MSTYLIYRPCLDCEDSMKPLLVCDTLKHTKAIRGKLIEWCHKKNKALTQYDEEALDAYSDDEREEASYQISLKRCDQIKALDGHYPHGLDELKEVFSEYTNDFTHPPHLFLEVRKIPYLRP